MSFLTKAFSILFSLAIVIGFVYAAVIDVKPPKEEIEKTLKYEKYIQK